MIYDDDDASRMERLSFEKRVKNLMEDYPPLPDFSRFHPAFRTDDITPEGDISIGVLFSLMMTRIVITLKWKVVLMLLWILEGRSCQPLSLFLIHQVSHSCSRPGSQSRDIVLHESIGCE